MRSRFTAYVVGNAPYLYKTTHPENESVQGISPEQFEKETLAYCRQVDFTSLIVHEVTPPDEQGIGKVKFTAEFQVNNRPDSFSELSEFTQLDGKWVYYRGELVK